MNQGFNRRQKSEHRPRRRLVGALATYAMIAVVAIGLTGCALQQESARPSVGPGGGAEPDTAPLAAAEPAQAGGDGSPYRGAAAGTPQGGAQDELLREMTLEGEQRKVASEAATREAERLIGELDYGRAEQRLEEALRLDPKNERARDLHKRVLFILGDRRGEIHDVARLEADREKVRRQQAVLEMEKMYLDAAREAQAGDYDKAVEIYETLLERIEWFPYNLDLSDLRTRAQRSLESADAEAQRQGQLERQELERRVRETADFERERSLRFVQSRIESLLDRMERHYAKKEFEEVIRLAEQLLDLDGSNRRAKSMLRRASELRRLYRAMRVAKRHREEWDRSFLAQLESEIPYHKIFNFPSQAAWKKLARRSLSVTERLRGSESRADTAIEMALQSPIEVEFEDRDFMEVIEFLQSLSGINFVLTSEAREQLEDSPDSVNLAQVKDLPLKNVLRLVLDTRDPKFNYVIKSGAILIGPAESINEDFYLEFYLIGDLTKPHPDYKAPRLALDEDEGSGGGGGGNILDLGDDDDDSSSTKIPGDVVKELVEKAIWGTDGEAAEGESVEFQTGKLVVSTTIENHEKVAQLLESLRKSTGVMVTVESRFMDLQENFLESIGIDFGNPFSTNLPNPINDIDGQGTQISPGYEFVDAQGQTDVRAAVYNAFSQPLGSQVAPFQLSGSGGTTLQYNVLDTYILEAILEANAKTQEFKKLDAPRVTAFNGQISHSLVIDQSAYIKDAEVNQTGVIPVINPVIGILNAGSILQVRPTVSYDRKYVILEIEPTLAVQLPSRFKRLTLNLTNLDVEFPVLSVTKIKTTVTVPDGGTVLVGGLKRTITQDQHVGVPFVSHVPFLNLFFGRKGQARMQSNLFVLLNAQITVVRDEERAQFN